MEQFIEINPQQAWQMMRDGGAVLLDVRDESRFRAGHAQGAFHLTNQSYGTFQNLYDYDFPAIVTLSRPRQLRHGAILSGTRLR